MTQTTASRLAGSVQHMCFVSAEGELFLAVARNQGVEILDSTDGTSLRVVYDRPASGLAALPTPGGSELLLIGGVDGYVHGVDPVTGVERLGRSLGSGAVKDVEVFTDATTPDVVAILDSGAYLWRPSTDRITRLPDPPGMDPNRLFKVCAYTVDGREWVTCAYTDGDLATWDLGGPEGPGAPLLQRAHDGPIWSLINSTDSDGRPIVVSGGSDRRMRVWSPDPTEGLVARQEFVADGTIRRLGHLADRQTTMLLTASARGSISLWRLDGSTERPEMEISRHSGEAWALVCAPTPNGVLIASGDMNGAVQIKRLSTALLTEATIATLFQTTNRTIWAVTQGVRRTGGYVACGGVDQTVDVVDLAGGRDPLSLRHHTSTVRALTAFGDADRPHLISGGADHRVLDWDPGTGQLRAELPMGHQGEVWALSSFVDDGVSHVVSGSADGSVRIIPVGVTSADVRVLAADCGEVSALVVVRSEDDILVVVGSGRGLRALSVRQGGSRPLSLNGISAACAVENAGRRLVVVARQDGFVELIDPYVAASITIFESSYESGQVRALQTVEVGGTTFVLGGCDDGRVLVWHLDGTLVSTPVRGGTAGIRSMEVVELVRPADRTHGSRTQSALATAGQDGILRLWPITLDSPLRSGGSVGRTVRPASILLQDQPTNTDLLSRDPLVETLHAALTSPATKPPVVVGVHAPWGHGKSSLLRQIRTRIDPWSERNGNATTARAPSHRLVLPGRDGEPVRTRLTRAWAWSQIQRSGDHNAPLLYEMRAAAPGTHDAITVWFNPWMYERTDQIWAGLTREILIAITERLPKPERERLWFDLNLRRTDPAAMRKRILASYIPRSILGLLLGGLLFFLVAVAVVAMGIAAVNNPTVIGLLGPSTLVLLTVLGTIAQLTSGSFKQIHGWVSPDELNSRAGPEHAWKGRNDPLTSTDRGYLYMLQHDVGEVVGLATKHGPLYVFIDDLDRCKPAIVGDTVEAINLFLNKAFGQCVFVVALDPATVAAHLETTFKDINDRAHEDATSFGHLKHTGWRFMEKIIDLPIRLPRVQDPALSEYLDRLLDATPGPGAAARLAPPPPAVSASPSPAPSAPAPAAAGRAPKQRRRPAPDAPATGRTSVAVVVVNDAPTTDGAVATVEALEELPPVRDALRAAVLSLPARNPRQTKAFINLWRFYMVLDQRMGLFSPSLLAIQRHSIEMARLVELMVRWPYLLDPLGELAGEGVVDSKTTNLDQLLAACDQDDQHWERVARQARLDPEDRTIQGLRELLRRALPQGQVFAAIARRYL